MQLLTWFEIPSYDLERAARFYSAILGFAVPVEDFGGHPAGVLRVDGVPVGGIRCSPEHLVPSDQGINPYFRVADIRSAVEEALEHGGEVIVPVTDAGDLGLFAWIRDSEGNRIALNQLARV